MPEPVRDLFAEAGVLNAFPNDRPSSIDDSDAYFRTPGDAQSYDWDLKMDTLEDVAEPEKGDSKEDEVTCCRMNQPIVIKIWHCHSQSL